VDEVATVDVVQVVRRTPGLDTAKRGTFRALSKARLAGNATSLAGKPELGTLRFFYYNVRVISGFRS
jgi:predicted SAM-dependent methyltransferase